MILRYSPELTRELYRIIILEKFQALRSFVENTNYVIGNAQFGDIDIRDGRYLFCRTGKLIDNTNIYRDMNCDEINRRHAFDADGVWVPTNEAIQ